MTYIILTSILIMFASLAGVLFTWKHAGSFIEKHLTYLVSFSAGVFLIVAYQLGVEVFEIVASPAYGLAWILGGAILLGLTFRLLPTFHHHHNEGCDHHHNHSIDTRRIVLGDVIHNIGDGILLAAAFAVSVPLGLVTAASVFVHELVQEISEFFVLRESGATVREALKINFIASSTILIGSVGGYFLINQFQILEVPLLGIAAGSFLVVVLYDLVPHSVRSAGTASKSIRHIVWFFVGIALMFSINQFGVHVHGGDSHDHIDEHGTHEEEFGDHDGEHNDHEDEDEDHHDR